MSMAEDIKYTVYPSYKPYGSYVPYTKAVEEAAAKMSMSKRHEMHIDESDMDVDVKRTVSQPMTKDNQPREEHIYDSSYGTYE
jgi:hypothetical protein